MNKFFILKEREGKIFSLFIFSLVLSVIALVPFSSAVTIRTDPIQGVVINPFDDIGKGGISYVNNSYVNNSYYNLTSTIWNESNGEIYQNNLSAHVGIGTNNPDLYDLLIQSDDDDNTFLGLSTGQANGNATISFRELNVLRWSIFANTRLSTLNFLNTNFDRSYLTLFQNGVTHVQVDSNLSVTENIWAPNICYTNGSNCNSVFGNITASNITADYFFGDGSQLTGIEQGELILYFLNSTSDDVAGNKTLSSIPNMTEHEQTGTGLGDGSTLMGTWITDSGVPNLQLIEGNIRVHVAGKKSASTKVVQFYFKLFITNATGGDPILLSTSEYSTSLTTTRTDYRIWVLVDEIMINSTNRIMVEGYAYVSGVGAAPDVTAYIQGASKTRLVIPVGAVSIEKFVPYSGAVSDVNLGTHNLTATGLFGYLNWSWIQNYPGSYNVSYHTWLGNYSEYQPYWYNYSLYVAAGSTYNSSYEALILSTDVFNSTFNSSYATWASIGANVSTWSITWNDTYDHTTNSWEGNYSQYQPYWYNYSLYSTASSTYNSSYEALILSTNVFNSTYNATYHDYNVSFGKYWYNHSTYALQLTGGTMAGNINMSGNQINNLGNITYQNSTGSNTWRTYVNGSGALITEYTA